MRIWLTIGLAAFAAPAWAAMPAPEQNALVKKYCAVCHTDTANNGGLSLEHYNASKRDPALARMLLSKLTNGAMGAAGHGVPDKPAQLAWIASTREQAAGANEWFVNRENGAVSASIVREVAPRNSGSTDLPVYRLNVACDTSSRKGEMQLTWSPQPQTGRGMVASSDGHAPVKYRIEGKESMGNGATVLSGHASVVLVSSTLPDQTLTVRELFPQETVEFPFSELDAKVRAELRTCFESGNGRALQR